MKSNKIIYSLTLSLILIGCATKTKKAEVVQAKPVTPPAAVSTSPHYTSLSFEKGETRLGADDKKNLQDLALKVKDSGRDVDDIKIITWADQEYGLEQGQREASNTDIILARQRAESIKRFLQEDLMEDEDIDFYNMAQKPGSLSRFFKTDDTKVKDAFKANNDSNMTGETRASKGLVIIEYENTNNI